MRDCKADYANVKKFMEKHMDEADDSEKETILMKSRLCSVYLDNFYEI